MSRVPFTPDQYGELVSKLTPPSRMARGYFRAFWVGGVICCVGQALTLWAETLHLGEITAPMFTASVLVFLGATLTGIGVYDRIGRYAGAGSAIPITGFANSMAAPAIEFQREGAITGVGARLFTLAGPVLAYGIASSVVVGIVYWLIRGWVL
ncbi:MAG: SpoVA/SpoVAEb family sporulation membrane protein [Clostridia bacterium]|nr:SpoVA/SpoVAEb family sporulation membrane protein [Clostridia bacterium]